MNQPCQHQWERVALILVCNKCQSYRLNMSEALVMAKKVPLT